MDEKGEKATNFWWEKCPRTICRVFSSFFSLLTWHMKFKDCCFWNFSSFSRYFFLSKILFTHVKTFHFDWQFKYEEENLTCSLMASQSRFCVENDLKIIEPFLSWKITKTYFFSRNQQCREVCMTCFEDTEESVQCVKGKDEILRKNINLPWRNRI